MSVSETLFIFLNMALNTFGKEERLCSGTLIDELFSRGNRSISSFPVRIVWKCLPTHDGSVKILISAPKRSFRNAVDRNRIKRQIREFYRTSSGPLKKVVKNKGIDLMVAFLFTDRKLWPTAQLTPKLQSILSRLVDEMVNS